MSELKIKVTMDGMTVELEGEAESVKEIFVSLKESGMGYLSEFKEKAVTASTESMKEEKCEYSASSDDLIVKEADNNDIPSLMNVVLSGGPRTESEWILVYAFYISEQGTKLFSKEELRQCYKDTNRYTDTRNKNFSSNIKTLISEKFISAINKDDFRIEQKGLELALNIVCGKIKKKEGKKRTAKIKSSTMETYNLVELNLSPDERNSLKDFYTKHNPQNTQDKTVVIAKWLKDIKGIDEVDKDLIFTGLRTVSESTSFNIGQALLNAKNQKSYYTSTEAGKFKINHIGEDHVDRDMMGKDK